MPFKTQPSLQRLGGKNNTDRFVISFAYDFTGDTPLEQTINGILVVGSLITINVNSLSNVLTLPAIRSMQFSQEFEITATDTPCVGPLNIFVPATGYMARIAYGGSYPNPFGTSIGLVSGIIPIVSNDPSIIQFLKSVDADDTMRGNLTAALFTFDVPPFIVQGLSDTD